VTENRIALVVKGNVFDAGGVESSTQRIARALAEAGPFGVDLIMLRPDQGRSAQADFYDAEPLAVRDGVRLYELPALSADADQPERSFGAHLGLIELCRRNRYRLLHGLYASVAGFHAAYAAAELGIPAVVGLRGNDIHADVFHALRFGHLRWALDRAAAVTAVSTEALRRADVLTGCGPRGRVILNSIDPAAYHEGTERQVAGDGPVFGTLAKFRSKKAGGTLVAAFALLVKEVPQARLVLAGSMSTDAEAAVRETADAAGVADRVTLTGAVERADALRHIRGMDVFVHSALHDGCPNTVLEAMAAGTPVVSTAVGAVPEMITSGREGLLVDPAGSPGALCEGMLAMLDADRAGLAAGALEAVRTRFAPDREARELVEVYESVLPAVRGRAPRRAVGYAAAATGGEGGPVTTVRSVEGLWQAVAGDAPKVVLIDGTVELRGQIDVGSNTTIAGTGVAGGALVGGGLRILGRRNVIVRDLTIGLAAELDGVTVQGSELVWIDHNEFYSDREHGKDFYDGLVDIVHGSDLLTLSWNVFRDHFKTMLIGHSDDNSTEDEGRLRVTLHHNWFRDVHSRTPSIRFGTLHAFNNLYERVDGSAVNVRTGSRGLIEANVFTDCEAAAVSRYGRTDGSAVLRDNILAGARVGAPAGDLETVPYPYRADPAADVDTLVRGGAGPRPRSLR
jgi:pectate lyase/glycosyltransferase involved in cell wall biosynthesis